MQTIVNICISDLFSQRDRGMWYGLLSVVWALASAVGPVIGGVFTSKAKYVLKLPEETVSPKFAADQVLLYSWRWCFWINRQCDLSSN
jgi:MFS family permease